MEISDAYRKARRNTSIFCGISLAWSAAQFDLDSLTIGAAGKVDISNASIPVIIACLIIFAMGRCTIEYMMQEKEIRRWQLAQLDYKITLNLLRLSLLAITASIASRSIETVVGVTLAALTFLLGYFVLVFIGTMILMPLRMFIRSLQGRISVASSAIEAVSWSFFIVALIYVLLFLSLGFSIFEKVPILNKLPPIPQQVSTIIFSVTAVIIVVSFLFERVFLNVVFAFEPVMIERSYLDENGKKIFSIKPNPAHPEYEKNKHLSPLVYTKVEHTEKSDTSEKRSDFKDTIEKNDENMKYILKKLVLARTPDIPIGKERFEAIREAKKILLEAFSIEEKYELLLSNFLDLQKEPLMLASDYMIRERLDYSGFFDIRLLLNKRIVNLLTSTKLYIDHLQGHIQYFFGADENIIETVNSYLSNEYDSSFEYRFMEALRNHVQHSGLAVHLTPIDERWKTEGDVKKIEHSVSAYAQKKYLSENKKFKKLVLNEMPDDVDLLYASKMYISSLNNVHINIREKIKDLVGESRKIISQATQEYSKASEDNSIGLSAISYSGEFLRKNFNEEIPLLLDWDDVRIELEEKNRRIINLGKRYVSEKYL